MLQSLTVNFLQKEQGVAYLLAYSITSLYGWDFKLLAGAKLLELHKIFRQDYPIKRGKCTICHIIC
jgi:hypothetical protein